MRRVSYILLAVIFCSRARAQDLATRSQIQHVITAQIEAFRHDDGVTALSFAAPNIRAKFSDGQHFLDMVRDVYKPVFRPRSFSFGTLNGADEHMVQKVELVGPDGKSALALYDMEHEADGSWAISGCGLTKSERLDL